MKRICFFFFFLFFFFVHVSIVGVTIGLNNQPSREARAFLPTGVDNLMQGFAVMENGFVFEDSVTTCSFDTFFSVFSDIVLSRGTLELLQDLDIKSPFSIGPGTIEGEGHGITFHGDQASIDLPTLYHTDIFSLIDTKDAGKNIQSIDWSHDDKYLAIGTNNEVLLHNELQIYYFDGDVLTLTISKDLDEKVNSVKWHPFDYYLALGHTAGGDELDIYYLNVPGGTLDLTDSENTSRVNAVAWSPTGSYLAAGLQTDMDFFVFEVSNGVFGSSYIFTFSVERTVEDNAIDWDYTSSYIAVGLDVNIDDGELKVLHFSGSALSENAQVEVGGDVYGVKWKPGSSTLAMVQDVSSERLRLYEHDGVGGTLTEITSARIGDGITSLGVDWSFDGRFLGLVKEQTTSSHDFRVYCFDDQNKTLSYVSGCTSVLDMNCIAWTNSEYYVAVGDDNDIVCLFKPTPFALRFKDVRVFFNSDVVFRGPVIFDGNCFISGNGHTFSFSSNGAIVVAEGSSVILEHAHVKGVIANNVACLDDDGLLLLNDVYWNQDSIYTFSVGALQFENEVLMNGDATFVYNSSQTSTILAKTNLMFDEGFTFSYDPGSYSKNLLEFEDDTSTLILNSATIHATVTGLQLTKGRLRVMHSSVFSAEKLGFINEGITIGDQTSQNDLVCEIEIGSSLNVASGTLNYKNVNSSSWSMDCYTSNLYMHDGTRLNLYESISLGHGILTLGNGMTLGKARGKDVTGSKVPLGTVYNRNI